MMKQKLALLIIFIGVNLFSQDQLFLKDNSKLEVKILEISSTDIKYKLFNNGDSSIISMLKKDVALIIYKNGTHEIIENQPEKIIVKEYVNVYINSDASKLSEKERIDAEERMQVKMERLASTKNFVALNLLEPFNGCVGLVYLRELANNHLNLYVPINVGFMAPWINQEMAPVVIPNKYISLQNYTYTRKIIEVGLGINFQASGQKSFTYFAGPLVDFGQYTGSFSGKTFSPIISVDTYQFILNRWSFMINNGFLLKPSKNFNIILNVAMGARNDTYINNDPANYATGNSTIFFLNAFKLGLCVGYKF